MFASLKNVILIKYFIISGKIM